MAAGSNASVAVPEMASWKVPAEGLLQFIAIPVTVDPFWQFTGEGKDAPPFTVNAVPIGAAQVPSPRQNVELEAEVPLLRWLTARFPVTIVERLTCAHVASPRHTVELEADVPPFKFVTGRFPVTPPFPLAAKFTWLIREALNVPAEILVALVVSIVALGAKTVPAVFVQVMLGTASVQSPLKSNPPKAPALLY